MSCESAADARRRYRWNNRARGVGTFLAAVRGNRFSRTHGPLRKKRANAGPGRGAHLCRRGRFTVESTRPAGSTMLASNRLRQARLSSRWANGRRFIYSFRKQSGCAGSTCSVLLHFPEILRFGSNSHSTPCYHFLRHLRANSLLRSYCDHSKFKRADILVCLRLPPLNAAIFICHFCDINLMIIVSIIIRIQSQSGTDRLYDPRSCYYGKKHHKKHDQHIWIIN
jgi:hypothetical protein